MTDLRKIRREFNMTQEEMASVLGLSPRNYQRAEYTKNAMLSGTRWARLCMMRDGNEPQDDIAWNGDVLYRLRTGMGMTQKLLAEKLGTTRVTISFWELGRCPSAKHLDKLCTFFEVKVDSFFTVKGGQSCMTA